MASLSSRCPRSMISGAVLCRLSIRSSSRISLSTSPSSILNRGNGSGRCHTFRAAQISSSAALHTQCKPISAGSFQGGMGRVDTACSLIGGISSRWDTSAWPQLPQTSCGRQSLRVPRQRGRGDLRVGRRLAPRRRAARHSPSPQAWAGEPPPRTRGSVRR